MTATSATPGWRSRGRRNLLVAVVAIFVVAAIAGGGYGLWYILIGPTGPGAVSEADPVIPAGASVPAPATFDGSWQVNQSLGSITDFSSSWVGYRVKEKLAGVGGHTAIGRTPKVTGSLTLSGPTVSAVSITADLTVLVSDDPQRDDQLRRQALKTDSFPAATFTLNGPIDLGTLPADGKTVSVTATGSLTIHGTSRTVQISLQAQRQGGIIAVAGSLPIVFADYGFSGPNAFNVVSVDDHGLMELHVLFTHV
jgi:polyisoprenoid-binding protein YceI